MDNWTAATQARTKATATKHGETWTSADLELVDAFAAEANAELAEALGRTLFAIQSIKSAIRNGARNTERVAISDRPYRGWMEGMGDE